MKKILFSAALLVIAASIVPAADPPAKKPAAKKSATAKKTADAKPPAQPQPQKEAQPQAVTTVPKDAQPIAPYTYRWVDAKGKAWIFRETPFGVVKMDEAANTPPPQETASDLKAVVQGDTVQFEKASPFGAPVKWTRKKTELNAEEREALERAQPRKD
jgi:hypothetical protein